MSANPELADPSLLTPGKFVKIPPYGADCVTPVTVTGPTDGNPSSPSESPTLPALCLACLSAKSNR